MDPKRISEWLQSLDRPGTVELRFRDEIIDSIALADDTLAIGEELIDIATSDAHDAGRTRVYTMVSIHENGERTVCPMRLRARVDRGTTDQLATLAKQNTELHECLRKERKEGFSMVLAFAETVSKNHARLVAENEKHSNRVTEVVDRLENLRTKQLERDLLREHHDHRVEIEQRITDAVVPLGMAIAAKVTGGKLLQAPDVRAMALIEIAKSMTDSQVDALEIVLGERWPKLASILSAAMSGSADVPAFKAYVDALPADMVAVIVQGLNVGQQAAIEVVLNGAN